MNEQLISEPMVTKLPDGLELLYIEQNELQTTTTFFGDADVFYLANTLTSKQLRREIHKAEIETLTHNYYQGTPYQDTDYFPWVDYAKCCREAINWQRAKPQTAPARGRIDIEAIKARNDIVALAENFTSLRKSGNNFIGSCPLHPDKHPSMVIYPNQQSWHCYQCNQGGDIFDFVKAANNTDFKGAAAILGGR